MYKHVHIITSVRCWKSLKMLKWLNWTQEKVKECFCYTSVLLAQSYKMYISGGGAKNFILQDIVIEALMIKDAATGANIGWLLQFDET